MIPYKLTRSNRKTLSIYVRDNGQVEVKAPLRLAIGYINDFVEKKETWIKAKQFEKLSEKREVTLSSQVFVFGMPHIIKVGTPRIENGTIFVREMLVKEDAEKLLRELASRIITERTKQLSAETGIIPKMVRTNKATTRWGSCSASGSININWRLILGDAELADYVIVHELCHIKEHNHSKAFWQELEAILPNYKETRAKLKLFEKRLTEEGWL